MSNCLESSQNQLKEGLHSLTLLLEKGELTDQIMDSHPQYTLSLVNYTQNPVTEIYGNNRLLK